MPCRIKLKIIALDFSVGAEVLNMTDFGEGVGRIWLNSVECRGSERYLLNCSASSSGVNSCLHDQDAGVRCLPGKVTS